MVSKDTSNAIFADGQDDKKGDDLPPTRFEDVEPQAPTRPKQVDPQEQIKDLQQTLENLNHELTEAKKKAEENWEKLLRKEAELQNVQRRSNTQVENTKKFALERFAAELLQVADSIEQGLTHTENEPAGVEGVIEGLTLTRKVLLDVMKNEGIHQIDPVGAPFDPNFHEAISIQETNDVPPHQVLAVVQKGYSLKDRLLRPARVVVSRAVATEGNEDASSS